MLEIVYILLFVCYMLFGMVSLYLALTLKKEQVDNTTWQFKIVYWHGIFFATGFSIAGFLVFMSFMVKIWIDLWLR